MLDASQRDVSTCLAIGSFDDRAELWQKGKTRLLATERRYLAVSNSEFEDLQCIEACLRNDQLDIPGDEDIANLSVRTIEQVLEHCHQIHHRESAKKNIKRLLA